MEKVSEARFTKEVKKLGCKITKYVDSSEVGAADRLVLTTVGIPVFVEWKDQDEKPRAEQIRWMIKMASLGYLCLWVTDVESAMGAIRAIQSHQLPHSYVRDIIRNQIRALG